MLLGHLLCGLVVGWLAALTSFWMGLSFEAMLGVYAVSANAAIGLSVLANTTPVVRPPAGLRYTPGRAKAVGSANPMAQERSSEDMEGSRQPSYS